MNNKHFKKRLVRAVLTLLLALTTNAPAWAQNSPTVHVEGLGGKHGSIYVKGWCEDPDDLSTPMTVQITVKDNNGQPVEGYNPFNLTANLKRFGEDNQWHYNGFDHYLPITTAGTYKVDFVFVDATGDDSPIYNYSGIQVTTPYAVTYDANGGSGAPAQQQKSEGVALTLSSTVPTRDGHNFQRWTTEQDGGGTAYSPGATYTTDADVTLYAQWVASDFPGSGTVTDPYVISTTGQWNLFASNVNNGNSYSGKYFVLGADINVSTMAGTYDCPFGGTFDGKGHTMNLAINTTGTGGGHPNIVAAPFRYVNGATFRKINLTGTITRTDYPSDTNESMGGLIGILREGHSATITGCRSSVNINYSFSWDSDTWGEGYYFATGYMGGFIGWSEGKATITDCLFDGNLAGRPLHMAGFVGYLVWGKVTFNNCLMNGTGSPTYSTYCRCFYGKGTNGGDNSINNCYYTDKNKYSGQGSHTTATGEVLRTQLGYGWVLNGSGAVVPCMALQLPADANNISTISANNGIRYDKVVLTGRTLYRDGSWNTLCLPFNLSSFSGTPLEGATVKTLSSSAYSNGVLSLSFTSVSSIEAGKPYIVKWSSGSNIENPIFPNVAISNATANVETTYANFLGSYAPYNSYSYLYDAHNAGGNGMNGALSISDPAPVSGQNVYWYTNSGHTQSVSTIPFDADGNVTLYGLWSGTFNINYDLDGGTMEGNPTTYTIKDKITLVAPTREGYTFMGWTGSNGDTPQMTVTIPAGSKGDRYYTAHWIPRIEYVEYNTSTKRYETKVLTTQFTTVTNSTGGMGNGWYVVTGNVRVGGSIGMGQNNTARLILCDGARLTVEGRINLESKSTLIIYGQSNGTGKLNVGYAKKSYNAIGTPEDQRGGTVIVHSGTVVATTGGGAAIGGFGNYGHGGTVRVYGGNVTAKSTSEWASGIGGSGWYGEGGTVEILGGTVVAEGGEHGKAIGGTTGGESASDGSLSLGNMRVYASANASTPVNQGDRVSTCRTKYARIVKCTQHVGSGSRCQYCNASMYHVTYNNNNATGGTAPTEACYEPEQTVTILGNTGNLERTGYTFVGWNTKADGSGTSYSEGATFAIKQNITLYADWSPILELTGNADNSSAINAAAADGKQHRVILADRTIYRDGTWNTLVLPFNLANLSGTPLEGLTVKTLESSTLINGELTLNFANANSIEAGKPYIVKWTENADLVIRTTADWNAFANSMGTESYEGKTVVLAADVTADYRVGVYQRFKGIFDGRGHTLTFNKTWYDQEDIAPFCLAENATFRNLKIVGTINTSGKFAAGLVAISYGNCTIENCQSSIVINSSIDGDGTHGGFIGCCNSGGTVSFVNCLFDGTISGSNTTSCGGYVGWRNASLIFTNCLMAGTMSINQTSSSAIFNRNGGSTLTNCYYKGSFGSITTQGTYTTDTGETLRALLGNGWEVSGGNVVPKMNPNIVNPVFENVFISDATANVSTTYADFIGSYAPITDDGLLLDAHNPNGDAMHAAIRAKLKGYSVSCYTKPDTNYPATSIPFSADGNVTLWTICIPIDYSITYNLNGGTNHPGNPATYNIESTTITLQEPSKTKYIFGGWFYNEDCTGDAVTTIAHGSHGNVTLYAKWLVENLVLVANGDNSSAISEAAASGRYCNVTLADCTIYTEGSWNTLCLPFDVDDFTGTPLEGATLKTLEQSYYNNGTLSMTFADVTSIEAGKPYIVNWDADLFIRSASDWNTFASNVEKYTGKVVKLVADINVSSMVGGTFKGTLDGCGHTITINLSSGKTEQIALFNTLENATIQNLKIAGTITFGKHRPASIASYIGGNTTIKNCWSSVAIKSNYSSSDWVDGGAFVARVNSNATLNMSNCLFTGSITYHANNFQGGGMVGWTQSNAKVNLSHCLFAPSSLTMSKTDGSTYVFVSGNVRGNLSGCYYNSVANKISVLKKEGTYTTATGDELLSLLGDGWEVRDGKVVPKMIPTIENPVFMGFAIDKTINNVETDYADFIGSYAPFENEDLLLDAHNTNGDAMHAAISVNFEPVAAGYTFQGWCADADRTTPVTTIPFAEDGSVTLYAQWSENAILLADTEDNAAMLEALDKSKTYNVTLVNRLIDTEWNTLALPFDVTAEQLEQTFGAEVRLFELAGSSLEDKVLGLSFKRAESIEAGKPYFIAAAEDVREPKFLGVTIDASANITTETDYVDFVPTLGATQIFGYGGSAEEPGSVWSVLILGGGNTLYNPASLENAWMRGYRGYFQIHDKEGNADESLAAQFRLTFDDSQEVSGIFQVKNEELRNKSSDATYNLMGMRVKNADKGLFIIKGKKVIVR